MVNLAGHLGPPFSPRSPQKSSCRSIAFRSHICFVGMQCAPRWAAANGGVTNGGLRGVWPLFLEIGRNRPFSLFFCLCRPLPEGGESGKPRKRRRRVFFLRYPQMLKPPSLKPPTPPPFAALQPSVGHMPKATIYRRHFTRTLVNVGDLRWKSGGSCQYGAVGSRKFAKVRMKARACFWYTMELA